MEEEEEEGEEEKEEEEEAPGTHLTHLCPCVPRDGRTHTCVSARDTGHLDTASGVPGDLDTSHQPVCS